MQYGDYVVVNQLNFCITVFIRNETTLCMLSIAIYANSSHLGSEYQLSVKIQALLAVGQNIILQNATL